MFAAGWVGGQDGERASGRTTTGLFQFSDVIQEGVVLQMVSVVKSATQEKNRLALFLLRPFYWLIARSSLGAFSSFKPQVHISKTRFRRYDQRRRQYTLYWGVRRAFHAHFEPKSRNYAPRRLSEPP